MIRNEVRFSALFAVVIGLIVAAPLVGYHGLPAFAHDWFIAPNRIQWISAAREQLQSWMPSNFGTPNFSLFVYPLAAVGIPLVEIFGPAPLYVLIVVGSTVASILGIVSFARIVSPRASMAIVWLVSTIYAISPYTFTEYRAGHLSELISHALLPWLLVLLVEVGKGSDFGAIFAAAAILVCAAVAAQYAIMGLASILIACAFWPAHALRYLGILAMALAAEAGTVAIYAIDSPTRYLLADSVTLHWEYVLSAPVLAAAAAMGYTVDYAARAYGASARVFVWSALLWWLLPLCAFARSATLNVRAIGLAILLSLLGWLLTAGLNGPLAALLTAGFQHIGPMAVMRELYHFAALVPLVWCCGLLALEAALPLRFATSVAVIVALPGTLVLATPFLDGQSLRGVGVFPSATVSEWNSAATLIATDRTRGSVFFEPSLQPIGASQTEYGVDPEAAPIASHPYVGQFAATSRQEFISSVFRRGDRAAAPTLAAWGIEYVVLRPHWRSFSLENLEPALKPVSRLCQRGPAPATPKQFSRVFTGANTIVLRNDLYADSRHVDTSAVDAPYGLPPASFASADPREAWVRGATWADCFPKLASLPYESDFTLSRHNLAAPVPSGARYAWLWAPDGAVVSNGSARSRIVAKTFVALTIPSRVTALDITPQGPAAFAGFSRTDSITWWRRAASGTALPQAGLRDAVIGVLTVAQMLWLLAMVAFALVSRWARRA